MTTPTGPLHFDVRGVTIAIEARDEHVADAIRRRLHCHASTPAAADLAFTFDHTPHPGADDGRVVYDSLLGPVKFDDARDRLGLSGRAGGFVCSCAEGRSHGWTSPDAAEAAWLASRGLLTFGLLELLRRRRLFTLHAASVERDGRAVVIAGASGAGKSTLALALSTRGFSFMGDDLVLIDERDGDLTLGALCEELDVTPWTASLIPQLAGAATPEPNWLKTRVLPEEVFASTARDARPGLILFPRRDHAHATPGARPVGHEEAATRLAPDILLTDRRCVGDHLAAIARMVEASRVYDVYVTPDLDAVVRVVESLADADT